MNEKVHTKYVKKSKHWCTTFTWSEKGKKKYKQEWSLEKPIITKEDLNEDTE